jgi:Ulp1 family protease
LTIEKIILHQKDINALADGHWLNDEVLNAYVASIVAKSKYSNSNYAASSFFFPSLSPDFTPPITFEKVQLWTKKVDIFQSRALIYPINQGSHRSLVVVLNLGWLSKTDTLQLQIITMDSMDQVGGPRNCIVFSLFRDYLTQEAQTKSAKIIDPATIS